MVGADLVVRYDGLLAMLSPTPPFSRVHKALVLALIEKHEVLQGAGHSLVSCLISNYLQVIEKAEYIVEMLAESGPAGRWAGEFGVDAFVLGVVEGEAECEARGYCDLEVLSLPPGQL
jgi:hypothetical protein